MAAWLLGSAVQMSMGNGYPRIVFSGDPSRTAPAAQSRVQEHIARAQFAHAGEPKREGQSSGYMGHGHLGSQVQRHRCAATFVSTQCLVECSQVRLVVLMGNLWRNSAQS